MLSTESKAPCLCAISEIACISAMEIVGFPGVSMCINFVLGRIAAFTASVTEVSTMVVSASNLLLNSSLSKR